MLEPEQAATAAALDAAGAHVLCGPCRRAADAEEAARPIAAGRRCTLALYQSGPFSDLFITAVGGDLVTVGVLGMAGVEPARVRGMLAAWWPAGLWDRDPLTFSRSELRMKGL